MLYSSFFWPVEGQLLLIDHEAQFLMPSRTRSLAEARVSIYCEVNGSCYSVRLGIFGLSRLQGVCPGDVNRNDFLESAHNEDLLDLIR